MNEDIAKLVEVLELSPHPEGGWYRQVYRSEGEIPREILPVHAGPRPYGTAILFLITADNFSAFHRIASDEIWFHHDGDPVAIDTISPNGTHRRLRVGSVRDGEKPQAVVPAGTWFASSVAEGSWALVGCAVSPGFDFADFELAERQALVTAFPDLGDLIRSLTR